MDGTKFEVFLGGGDRQTFVTKWFEEHAALRDAAGAKDAELLTTDIVKAWFVIHDVAAGRTLRDDRYLASQKETKKGAVHGFVNRNGLYAATHDFTKNRQATVYEFLSRKGRKVAGGLTINIETVPDIEDVPVAANGSSRPPTRPDLYASIGYRRRVEQKEGEKPQTWITYYKWTKTAFDVLADLYVFASARAAHLLTVTVHKEMDRNP